MSLQPREPQSIDDNTNRAEGLKVWNCINCRRRKVRCDRRHPCAPCTKNKSECVFPVSGRVPRRSRDSNYPSGRAQKQFELVGRLRRLEAMVGDLGSQVEHASAMDRDDRGNQPVETLASTVHVADAMVSEIAWPDHQLDHQVQSPGGYLHTMQHGSHNFRALENSIEDSSQGFDDSGDLIEADNGDLIVKDHFWTVFCNEVEQIFDAVQGPTNVHFHDEAGSLATASTPSTSNDRHHNGFYNFLFSHTTAATLRKESLPLPSQMLFLWQTYVDNIDPFMKVLHVPAMTKVVRELRGSYDSLAPAMRTLVLVIAMAAIMSLENEEVEANFNTSKSQLLSRYRIGAERAFEQADLLNSPDVVVLQALTIYLGVLQHTGEARLAWLLAGVLVRAAVSMGLHRNGSHFHHLTLFEKEMRHRLWWQICFIDSQSIDKQVSAFKISEGMFDAELPMNMDDTDLSPEMIMPLPAIVEGRWTDMTISLIHCEIWTLSQRLQSLTLAAAKTAILTSDFDALLNVFHQTRAVIEKTHFSHLNPNSPLQDFAATTTRLFFTKVSLILTSKHHLSSNPKIPYLNSPPSTQSLSSSSPSPEPFSSALLLLQQTTHLQTHPAFHPYRWSLLHKGAPNQSFTPPWHALHIILSHLLSSTSSTQTYTNSTWTDEYEQAYIAAKTALSLFLPSPPNHGADCEAGTPDPRYRNLSRLLEKVEARRHHHHHHHYHHQPTTTAGEFDNDGAIALPTPILTTTTTTATTTGNPVDSFPALQLLPPPPLPIRNEAGTQHSISTSHNNGGDFDNDDDDDDLFGDDVLPTPLEMDLQASSWTEMMMTMMGAGDEGWGV